MELHTDLSSMIRSLEKDIIKKSNKIRLKWSPVFLSYSCGLSVDDWNKLPSATQNKAIRENANTMAQRIIADEFGNQYMGLSV